MAKPKIPRSKRKPSPKERREESAKEIVRAQRADSIMSMKRQGWPNRAIGASLDPPLSHTMVQKIIHQELASIPSDHAIELRKLELARLDEMQTGHYSKAVDGDMFATQQVLAIMNRRAKLAGLDTPEKSVVVTAVDDAKSSLEAKLNLMAERLAAAAETPADQSPQP